jgi:HSP20 family protein
MSLVPWRHSSSPVFGTRGGSNELTSFQREMNNLMSNFFNRSEIGWPSVSLDSSFYPSVDVKEKDDKYLLDADLPGMDEKEIEIDFHDNILTIKGEKKAEAETKDVGCICVERSVGSFRRDIAFSEPVDGDKIKAELKSGVLRIELAKKEKSKTAHKKIAIKQ